MKRWAAGAALLMLAGLPAAQAAVEDKPTPEPTPVPAVPPSHLKLGPYAGFNQPAAEFAVPELLRFETEVEVRGKSPNAQMFDWWEHFTFDSSVYGRGIDVQNPIPGSSHGYSIVPGLDWLRKKVKNKGMKSDEDEEDLDPKPKPKPPPP